MRTSFYKKIFFPIVFILVSILGLAAAASAQQNLSFFSCTPVQVASFKTYTVGTQTFVGRVWVQCNPPLNADRLYFAVPLSDAAEAARFLSLFTAAFVAGKNIEIGYIPNDTTGAAYNCTTGTTLCQPAISATIR